MKRLLSVALLLAFGAAANADVWSWVDENVKTHLVDTNTPI